MSRSTTWLTVFSVALLVLVWSGGFAPSVGALFATGWAAAWTLGALGALLGGPLLLGWLFVKGPPPRAEGLGSTAMLGLVGLMLCAFGLMKLPMLLEVLRSVFA